MDQIQRTLLEEVMIRVWSTGRSIIISAPTGQMAGQKYDGQYWGHYNERGQVGHDIRIKEGTKNESVHIPVVLSQSGMTEMVYNDFYIGDNADVTIIAGCSIHNGGDAASEHGGIHRFFIGRECQGGYVEKHYGEAGTERKAGF